MDPVPGAADRVPARRLRARHLRHGRQGVPCHPEQGVPGPRLRAAGDHRRHARVARASHRRGRLAARPTGRRGGAGGGDPAGRGGGGARSSGSPRPRARRTRRARRRPSSAGDGRSCSNGSSRRDETPRGARVRGGGHVRRRALGARRAAATRVLDRALRCRQPHAGRLVDRARRLPRGDRSHRPAVLAARRALRPDRRRLRAALVGLAGPIASPRHPGRGRGDRRDPRLPPRPPPSRVRLGGRRVRARVPSQPRDPVARPRRLPPRRARDAAPPVGVLVPRHRPARPVRDRRRRGVPDEGADRSRRRGDGRVVRGAARPAPHRSCDRRDRHRRLRRRRRRRRPALRPGRRIAVRRSIRVRRWVSGRDGRDGGHGSRGDPRGRDGRPRPRLPGRPTGAAPLPAAARAARGVHRAPRARVEPPLGHANADVDPLPLHRRCDPRAHGRGGPRRRPSPAALCLGTSPGGARDRRLDARRGDPPRSAPDLGARPVRVRPGGAGACRRRARGGRRASARASSRTTRR